MSLSLRIYERSIWKVLEVIGRLDAFADKRVMASLKTGTQGHLWVALDFQKCEFISIWAIKSLAEWSDELKKQGGRLLFVAPSDAVQRQIKVFSVTSFLVYPDWASIDLEAYHQGWAQVEKSPQQVSELSDFFRQ